MSTTLSSGGNAHPALPLSHERLNFKRLVLANPNHFGAAPGQGDIVLPVEFKTEYEQLLCLGLNPGGGIFAEGTLEAVLEIKRAEGYESGPCGAGSTEYVRFYAQTAGGWTDLGVASVNVFNLEHSAFPVSYAVSIPLDEVKKFCWFENILTVRAILSWEIAPPANTPGYVPAWGNQLEAQVQVAPALLFEVPIGGLLGSGLITIDPKIAQFVDLAEALPAKPPVPLEAKALQTLYANKNVPAHRWGFAAAKKALALPLNQALKLPPISDIAGILAGLQETSGDTYYEQLTCAGYNPQTRTLEAVITIKQDAGYSGGLCTAGSYEYVAFYAYFHGVWNALGAARVNVHDLQTIAAGDPLNYAVFRVSQVVTMPCESLVSIPLRAILSWQTVPTGPDYVPVWGNVLNTHIQPLIGKAAHGDRATIMRIGSVSIIGITLHASGDYLANPTGVAGDCAGDDSPFGGTIDIEGDFNPKVDGIFNTVSGALLPGGFPIIYQAFITYPGSATPVQLLNSFGIEVYPPDAPILDPSVTLTQAAVPMPGAPAGQLFYTYYETDGQAVDPRTLAVFQSGGLDEGEYTVTINGYIWDGAAYQPMPPVAHEFHVYNGYQLNPVNKGSPYAVITLTSAADCGNVTVGQTITGDFTVTDEFFGSLSIGLTPITLEGAPVALPAISLFDTANNPLPNPVVYDGSNTNGLSGTFSFSTAGMPVCGYTIQANAADRALMYSVCEPNTSETGVGFCLVAAPD